MSGQQDTRRNRKTDASTEGPLPTALARKKLPARFVDEISNITISPNGACRLHFCTWSTDDHGHTLRIDTELILTRQTLTTLTEALPKALAQVDQSLDAEKKKSAKASGES